MMRYCKVALLSAFETRLVERRIDPFVRSSRCWNWQRIKKRNRRFRTLEELMGIHFICLVVQSKKVLELTLIQDHSHLEDSTTVV